jgi:hypothetical protein
VVQLTHPDDMFNLILYEAWKPSKEYARTLNWGDMSGKNRFDRVLPSAVPASRSPLSTNDVKCAAYLQNGCSIKINVMKEFENGLRKKF